MSKLARVLSHHDLPPTELSAARLDGEVYMVDEGYSPIDLPNGPHERALSIAGYCLGRLMAEQRTAAWIWGATELPPRRHELCASLGARARPAFPIRTVVREVVIEPSDLVTLGGIGVTTPLRTVIDLARFSATFDSAEQQIAEYLAERHGITLELCAAQMDARTNLPNKRRAITRLQLALSNGG